MRLLFCTVSPHQAGIRSGVQTTLHDLCTVLLGMGVQPAVLAGPLPISSATSSAPHLECRQDNSLGYPVFHSPDPARDLPALAAGWDASALAVTAGGGPNALVAAALGTGRPTSMYIHNLESEGVSGWVTPADGVLFLANSHFTAARWQALHSWRCEVVPPVVCAEPVLAGAGSHDQVLFVNPVPVKGVHMAFALAQACPELPFTFLPSWGLQPSWAAHIAAQAAALPNVQWLPVQEDMRSVYADTGVLLMPSVWEETFGRTVVEAQINGIPALASNRGALPQVVGDGGLLLDPHAPVAAWAQALRTMMEDPSPWATPARRAGLLHAAQAPLIAGHLLGLLAMHGAR